MTQFASLYNHTVMNEETLDQVFSALSDPTRRGMLAQLASGESNVRSLAEHYDMSQPAISKHLRVLERANLISREKRGRENIVRVDPRPIEGAVNWITLHAKFWRLQFDAVEDYLLAQGKIMTEGDET